ncbi:hypothetical protein BMS3Bbin10_01421 [bacterium BMS3Bbin10]|nr:hypothetical protein BMS3Bbin10_01421 [bacterium BMS3Bbin10]
MGFQPMTPATPPEGLRRALAHAGLEAALPGPGDLDLLPGTAGAYALILNLEHGVRVDRPPSAAGTLPEGWYVYAGSARGPGGIRARLARHFRTEKRPHWHIDQLTCAPGVRLWGSPAPDIRECDLVAKMSRLESFRTALPGFGSSDCRTCKGHLLVWEAKAGPSAAVRGI